MPSGRACAFALALLLSGAARADDFVVHTISLDGQPLPGGGAFSQGMVLEDVGAAGEALVSGYVWDGADLLYKSFLLRGDATDRVVLSEGLPAPGGGVFTGFSPVTNQPGHYAFEAVIDFQDFGLYRRGGSGPVEVIAEPGDPAPSPQATHGGALAIRGLNDADLALFSSTLTTPGGDRDAWILDDGGTQTLVAIEGGPTPLGGVFGPLPAVGGALGEDAVVVFRADVVGGSAGSGLFRRSAAGTALLYAAGDPVPTAGGGNFSGFYSGVDVNRSGAVAFVAGVDRPGLPISGALALFVLDGGVLTEIVIAFDPAPGSGTDFGGVWDFDLDDSGRVAFTAPVREEPWAGLFLFDGTAIHSVAYEGVPVLGLGLAFHQFNRVRLVTDGPVLFEGGLPELGSGVFGAVSGGPIPSLPAMWGGPVLTLLLLATAWCTQVGRCGPTRTG